MSSCAEDLALLKWLGVKVRHAYYSCEGGEQWLTLQKTTRKKKITSAFLVFVLLFSNCTGSNRSEFSHLQERFNYDGTEKRLM